VQKFLL